MCGIWGLFGTYNSTKIYDLFNTIKKRGTNNSILINNNNYKIGFHRLSIMDLSIKGDQPFTYSDDNRTIYIICNGEIYNHLELRKEFDLSYDFKSNSDCEVLIPLYLKYGMDFIDMLDAEYAFAIFDFTKDLESGKIKRNLYLSRDHLGIRPLFYTIIKKSIAFCSEMTGLQFEDNIINIV